MDTMIDAAVSPRATDNQEIATQLADIGSATESGADADGAAEAAPPAPLPTPKEPRRRGSVDAEARAVTCELAGETLHFPYADMPANSTAYLAGVGLRYLLNQTSDQAEMTALHARLQAGDIPAKKEPQEKISVLRQAIAFALVDVTKKTTAPLTYDAALRHVVTLSRAQCAAQRNDVAVMKHYNKLMGRGPSGGVASLLPGASS